MATQPAERHVQAEVDCVLLVTWPTSHTLAVANRLDSCRHWRKRSAPRDLESRKTIASIKFSTFPMPQRQVWPILRHSLIRIRRAPVSGCISYGQPIQFSVRVRSMEGFCETQHTSRIWRNHGYMQLWQRHSYAFHAKKRHSSRSLFKVPSVLYWETEDRRHGRSRRKVPEAIRNAIQDRKVGSFQFKRNLLSTLCVKMV